MMRTVTRPLPGIRFQATVPPPPELLPRMDIAAFVGLAASGPLHLPVAVEDIGRFRDIFGSDLPLAWDSQLGQMQTAHLGQAVEAFFRNGGRRCWVVRVAAAGERTKWHLPGVRQADRLEEPATIAARCSGSWADELRVGTVLQSETVHITFDKVNSLVETAVTFTIHKGQLQISDLLRVDIDDTHLFLAVIEIEPQPTRQRITAQPYWVEKFPDGSPPETGETWDKAAPRLLPAADRMTIALRLTFDLYVWRAEQLLRYLPNLGFHPAHPRSYEKLPTDAALFALSDEMGNPRTLTNFEQEVAQQPRFPLAFVGEPTGLVLPLDMADRPDSSQTVEAITDRSLDQRLQRDGLAEFGTDLFVSDRLATVGSRALLATLNDKLYVRNEALTGIHTVFPLEEVTLIAVPDAVQPGWKSVPTVPVQFLDAPTLLTVQEVADGVEIAWTAVFDPEPTAYHLAWSTEPDFATAEEMTVAADKTEIILSLPAECPTRFYYRLYAQRKGERSAWSNTAALLLPQEPFVACAEPEQPAPDLISVDEAASELHFDWSMSPPTASTYLWQSASDPGFIGGVKTAVLTQSHHTVPQPAAPTYFRVRWQEEEQFGAWSNTVHYAPAPKRSWILNEPDPASEATILLAIQRALLRFCAARADLFALLSLPANSRSDQAKQHQQQLLTAIAGESDILSYGAFYHPWLIQAVGATNRYAATPPDGAVCGLFASRALERGAWVAPANVPLSGIVSLTPVIANKEWPRFYSNQINLVHQDPRGFLLLSADTLSQEWDLRPINVRRLLILLRRLALREGQTYVFEPNSPAFHRLVQHRFEQLLALLYARGAFAGETAVSAYQVAVDSSLNSRQSLDQGRFIIELRVAPSQPLAFITVRLVQTERVGITITEV